MPRPAAERRPPEAATPPRSRGPVDLRDPVRIRAGRMERVETPGFRHPAQNEGSIIGVTV
jgi:hypothetical protein